jgi:hypothetical protein
VWSRVLRLANLQRIHRDYRKNQLLNLCRNIVKNRVITLINLKILTYQVKIETTNKYQKMIYKKKSLKNQKIKKMMTNHLSLLMITTMNFQRDEFMLNLWYLMTWTKKEFLKLLKFMKVHRRDIVKLKFLVVVL